MWGSGSWVTLQGPSAPGLEALPGARLPDWRFKAERASVFCRRIFASSSAGFRRPAHELGGELHSVATEHGSRLVELLANPQAGGS